MAEIPQFLGANSSFLYNWIVLWNYYLSVMVYCKENQVFRIIMKKESTEFTNLAHVCLCISFLKVVSCGLQPQKGIIDWGIFKNGLKG